VTGVTFSLLHHCFTVNPSARLWRHLRFLADLRPCRSRFRAHNRMPLIWILSSECSPTRGAGWARTIFMPPTHCRGS